MASQILVCLLFVAVISAVVDCNSEACFGRETSDCNDRIKVNYPGLNTCNCTGDALNAWKTKLEDPNNVLQSWDPTLVNPCTWFHVTCNIQNSVVRLDLGNGRLSGPLVPELGLLPNLQYLEVFGNNLSGSIPSEIGNLTNLVSLNLQHNKLSGPIPSSLGNLVSLLFMNLNSNYLSGTIPTQLFHLIQGGNLRVMNVSDNKLAGTVHRANLTVTTIIQDPRAS